MKNEYTLRFIVWNCIITNKPTAWNVKFVILYIFLLYLRSHLGTGINRLPDIYDHSPYYKPFSPPHEDLSGSRYLTEKPARAPQGQIQSDRIRDTGHLPLIHQNQMSYQPTIPNEKKLNTFAHLNNTYRWVYFVHKHILLIYWKQQYYKDFGQWSEFIFLVLVTVSNLKIFCCFTKMFPRYTCMSIDNWALEYSSFCDSNNLCSYFTHNYATNDIHIHYLKY